nr:ras-related protein RABE1c-like [Ipomoea batatas]
MASASNSKFGILLVKNGSERSLLHTIEEPWVFCWFMMLQMNHLLTAVPTAKGQALADEYGIKFFETSAKTNLNVEQVFFSIAKDIKQRLADTDSKAEPTTIKINQPESGATSGQLAQKSACCGS